MGVAGTPPLQFWTSGMLVAGLAKCSSLKRVNRIGSAMCAPILFVPQQQTLEMVAKNLLPKKARKRTGGIQMTTTATYETLSASEHSAQLRKAVRHKDRPHRRPLPQNPDRCSRTSFCARPDQSSVYAATAKRTAHRRRPTPARSIARSSAQS